MLNPLTTLLVVPFVGLCGVLSLSSCYRRVPTQIVLKDRHVLTVDGKRQDCGVEIRSDKAGGALLEISNDETGVQFTCDSWREAMRRDLHSELVYAGSSVVHWLDRDASVLVKVTDTQDFAGKWDGYLLYNFRTRRLKGTLYGLPPEERCEQDCFWDLKEKADQSK